ncbi:hypothetical protein Tco_0857684, partial [Tanacetum coccineum]
VHLKLVLEPLKKEKLFAKFSKYEFWLQEVHFLEHVVSNNDIHVDSSKIEAMKNLKVPKTRIRSRSRPRNKRKLFRRLPRNKRKNAFSRTLRAFEGNRQGRERDSRNVVWPGPTNGKEERWRFGEERVISCFCVLSLRSVFVKGAYGCILERDVTESKKKNHPRKMGYNYLE